MPVEICRYFQGWTQGLLQKSLTNEKVVALKGDKISKEIKKFLDWCPARAAAAVKPALPKICQSKIYYAWLLERWDKWIVDQESDVPSIFFILLINLGHSKLFIFIFVIL